MTDIFTWARRAAKFRAVSLFSALLVTSACASADLSDPATETRTDLGVPVFSGTAAASGIVYGAFRLSNSLFGSPYRGSVRQPGPDDILPLLAGARAAGGQLVLKLNSDRNIKNSNGTFSLEKWKSQVDRFKTLNLQPYISDGVFMGHYLLTEPEDAGNWGGKRIPQSTLEEMARYSKQIWPGLTTFVHSRPTYLASSGTTYRYLDAGWAMYHSWNGEVSSWIKSEVSAAKRARIGLVVGLNVLDGGTSSSAIPGRTKGRYAMSATQIKSWGSTLLNESYACGFFNWEYDGSYHGRSDIRSVMSYLSQRAQSHLKTSCRQGDLASESPVVPANSAITPPSDSTVVIPSDPPVAEPPSSTGQGIIFGQFQMSNSLLSSMYTGVFRLPGPRDIIGTLADARTRGGQVVVQLSNHDSYVKNSDGTFNLTKWKTQVARFKGINLESYISGGTLIGHYLIDEPDDPTNWGGKRIPPETVEEMAKYSKQLWPSLTTIVRSKPSYLVSTGTRFTYLDAGWAMYESWQRPTDVSTWIKEQVSVAKGAGLGLMVGLNLLDGGTQDGGILGFATRSGRYSMGANQVRSWGSTLLNESYVCGFFNFAYNSKYYGRSDIHSALADLAQKAKSHTKTACRQ